MQKTLFSKPTKPIKKADVLTSDDIASLVKRRRLQLIVHSCIYYELNTNVITDATFDMWAKELVKLQAEHKEISKNVMLYTEFCTWDGSTGYHLPYRQEWVINRARQLVWYNSTLKGEG